MQIKGIENIIPQLLTKWGFTYKIIQSQSTNSTYIKTHKGMKIRIADHKGHDNPKQICLSCVKSSQELKLFLTSRDDFNNIYRNRLRHNKW